MPLPGIIAGLGKALLPVGAEILGLHMAGKGQRDANRTNIELARENMAFQREMAHSAEAFSERMANTQISRRIADLRAAGLNPALAYEGSAASPSGVTAGGSQARVENVAASAYGIRQIQQAMDLAKQDFQLRKKTTDAAVAKTEAEKKAIEQNTDFARVSQPHQLALLQAQAMLQQLGLTGAENEAELEKWIKENTREGRATGGAKNLMRLMQLIIRR